MNSNRLWKKEYKGFFLLMKSLTFRIPDEDDPLYNAYRSIVIESDITDREPILAGSNILILPAEGRRGSGNG